MPMRRVVGGRRSVIAELPVVSCQLPVRGAGALLATGNSSLATSSGLGLLFLLLVAAAGGRRGARGGADHGVEVVALLGLDVVLEEPLGLVDLGVGLEHLLVAEVVHGLLVDGDRVPVER